ncbi:MAG TPA: hypothetical protein VLM80_02915 [Anaerolineales bacterium]|nr:hypothetical protein [Anaerolineales bacterium]
MSAGIHFPRQRRPGQGSRRAKALAQDMEALAGWGEVGMGCWEAAQSYNYFLRMQSDEHGRPVFTQVRFIDSTHRNQLKGQP